MAESTATEGGKAGTEAKPATPPAKGNVSTLPEDQRPPGDLRRRTKKDTRTGPFVKYVGAVAQRSIKPEEWAMLNITGPEDIQNPQPHVWDVSNDKLVEADKFSDAQLDYLLIDDLQQGSGAHAFLLVDYDDDQQLVQVAYE